MKKFGSAIVMAVLLIVVMIGTALALTITVDGIREAAWDSGGSVDDPNESNISDDFDITRFQWTNDQTNFYFLIETATATKWDHPLTPDDPYMWLCINNDNDTSTGSTFPSVCQASGYDRYIRIKGPLPTIEVFDATFTPITATINVAVDGAITEASIDLVSLGFDGSNCGLAPTGVYLDNRTADPDDNLADGADVPITCGTPTAITLTSLNAQPGLSNPTIALFLIFTVLLAFGTLSFAWVHRRLQ